MALTVCHLMAWFRMGGVETHTLYLARGLRRLGVSSLVVGEPGPLMDWFQAEGIECHGVEVRRHPAEAADQVAALCRGRGARLLHANMPWDIGVARAVSARTGIPLVASFHGGWYPDETVAAAREAAAVTSVCGWLTEHLRARGVADPRLIINGVDLDRFRPDPGDQGLRTELGIPADAPVVAFIGRLEDHKWRVARNMVRAAETLAERHPDMHAVVAGPLNWRPRRFRAAVRAVNRRQLLRVHYLGPRRDAEAVMRAATSVVGYVAKEALACGTPVVAAGLTGAVGLITPDTLSQGLWNAFGDFGPGRNARVRFLAAALSRVLADPVLRQELAAFGRAAAEQHWQRWRFGLLIGGKGGIQADRGGGPVRVAVLAPAEYPVPPVVGGSVELCIYHLATHLPAGHEVTVISPGGPGLPSTEEREGVTFRRLETRTRRQYLQQAAEWLAAGRWDLVQVDNRPGFLAAVRAAAGAARLVLFMHSHRFLLPARMRPAVAERALGLADRIVCNSRYLARRLADQFPGLSARFRVVTLGVDPEAFLPPGHPNRSVQAAAIRSQWGLEGQRVVLCAARLVAYKGLHHLLAALPLLPPELRDQLGVLVLGSRRFGSRRRTRDQKRLERLAAAAGCPVVFAGYQPPAEVPPYYAAADLVVCPSISEPFGLVNLEAMASGLPLVASAVGGIPEIVTDGATGLLVPPADPAALAAAMARALTDPDLAARLGSQARAAVERAFTWAAAAGRLAAVYDELMMA